MAVGCVDRSKIDTYRGLHEIRLQLDVWGNNLNTTWALCLFIRAEDLVRATHYDQNAIGPLVWVIMDRYNGLIMSLLSESIFPNPSFHPCARVHGILYTLKVKCMVHTLRNIVQYVGLGILGHLIVSQWACKNIKNLLEGIGVVASMGL